VDQQNNTAPQVAEWAADCREYTRGVLAALGLPPDLMQTDPGTTIRLMEQLLTQRAADTGLQTDEERVINRRLVMAFAAEFLIGRHGARWDWLLDAASPLGGRWVVAGFTHPLGQETAAVDVPGLAHEAMAGADPSLVDVINRAERLSRVRDFR
jgi:hypothetical protein